MELVIHEKNLHIISRVLPDGIGEELELEPGDALLSINGQPVEDVFDYRYLMNDEFVTLLIRKKNGEEWELEVEKNTRMILELNLRTVLWTNIVPALIIVFSALSIRCLPG